MTPAAMVVEAGNQWTFRSLQALGRWDEPLRWVMRQNYLLIGGSLAAALIAGCATPLALAPVGPNPNILPLASGTGRLEVFSALAGHAEGNDPTWFRHTDYYLCDARGKELRVVRDALGHYSQIPCQVTLPAGAYLIKACGKGILEADVPVVIKPGVTTEVHLDGEWQPPADAAPASLVSAPEGYFIGWRAPAATPAP